uniref:Inner centromere protein ARK-binding domain-containing protein n=1 Tax=Anopheles dirus TaxID=7168 RepID=A0A182N3J2_9DIPT
MDELLEMFNTFIGEALDRERSMENEFSELEKRLNECVTLANDRGTPVQNKKRPKRQASISEREEDTSTASSKDGDREVKDGAGEKQKQTAASRSSARMLDVTHGASLPQPMDTSGDPANDASSVRPSRTARLKAQDKLKEPSLSAKLRNNGGAATVTIKTERVSSTVANSTLVRGGKDAGLAMEETTFDRMDTENDANRANRSLERAARIDEGFASAPEAKKDEQDHPSSPSSREMSLMVIPSVVPKVELVSDEEMPPPSMPPPKMAAPKVRTKKRAVGGKAQPKQANDTASSSAVSSAESSMNSTASSGTGGRPVRGTSKAKQKTSTGQVAEPTQKEPEPVAVQVVVEPMRIKTEKLSIVQQQPSSKGKTSDKTEHSDPEEQQKTRSEPELSQAQLEKQMRPLQITLQKIVMPEATSAAPVHNMNETYNQPADSTFVTAAGPVPAGAFASPMENPCNATFDIPAVIEKGATKQALMANASIMTEDESVVENSPVQVPQHVPELPTKSTKPVAPVPGPKPKGAAATTATLKKTASAKSAAAEAKKNKELFNPCVMSPIKSRIEAFEKCATTVGTAKMGTPQAQMIGRLLKTVSTPTLASGSEHMPGGTIPRSAHVKPLGSTYTPTCAAAQPAPKASSASKVAQMRSRAAAAAAAATAIVTGSGGQITRSQSRDSSWDRAAGAGAGGSGTLSAASSTSSLLDEKKKKREEKQRLAAIQREAMEREKREHAERLVREKEEKYRKLVQEKQEKLRVDAQKKARKQEEFEKRRQQEEQKALADQKREELAKQLEQQRHDRELLDAVKSSQPKESHDTEKLHKQMYQQKLRQQHQQQQLAKKKAAAAALQQQEPVLTFEMIDTDDSTDEELDDEPSGTAPRKKRPARPEWCQNTADYRRALLLQARIESKVIDRLFSVQPMTPDLRELFPSIDAHKLKRNSSAIWRTPPRHSQLP